MRPGHRYPWGLVVRQLCVPRVTTMAGAWLLGSVLWLGAVTLVGLVVGAPVPDWQSVGLWLPKVALVIISLTVSIRHLPLFVAQGVTRRDFARGSLAYFGPVAALFALLATAGTGSRYLACSLFGPLAPVGVPCPLGTADHAGALFARSAVLGYLYLCAGWLAGVASYRLGTRRAGPLFAVSTTLVAVAEVALWSTERVAGTPWPGYAVVGACVLTLVTLSQLLIRDVEMRARPAARIGRGGRARG